MSSSWMSGVLCAGLVTLGCAAVVAPDPIEPGPKLHVASFDGLDLAYDDRGAGDPLLLIHGLACERGFWEYSASRLANDYRVITLDLGGHGQSGGEREQWCMGDMAGDVVALVKALDLENLVLVGHSMGGPVALLAAEQLPGRVRGIVAVEALHDPAMKMDLDAMEPYLRMMAEDYDGFWKLNVESSVPADTDPAIIERVLAVARSTPYSVTHGLMLSFADYDAAGTLAKCAVPVRCINAAQSPTRVEASQALCADFDAVTLEGVGHFVMLEAPGEFHAELVETLDELRDRE